MVAITPLSVPGQPDWICYRVSLAGVALGLIDFDGQQYWACGNFGDPTKHPTMESAIAALQ